MYKFGALSITINFKEVIKMTKTKNTRRALIASVLSLLVCISMLVGTTFAWFTDSVTSAGNKIMSGNLNIDMSVMDENGTYQSVKENSDAIFNYTLWEPGYTVWKNIKVSTTGSLALKYVMNIVLKGERSILADVIDVYYAASEIKKPADRSLDGLTRLGTMSEVLDSATGALISDTLNPDEGNTEDYATVVLKMQESANNDYQSKTIGEFDINLFATQLTYEEDSFDDQYDANAPIAWTGEADLGWYLADPSATELEISTAEELAGFAAIVNGTAEGVAQDSFKGQTVKLTKNIDLGDALWTPIGLAKASSFSGTFDGQGNTVYNLHIDIDDDRDYGGLFGIVNAANIKGLTIRNVDISAYIYVGAVVGYNLSGTVSDCHVKGNINIVANYAFAGGVIGSGYYSIDNCSVIADGVGKIAGIAGVAGGLVGRCNEGSHSFTDCVVKNLEISGGEQVGAITGFLHYGNIVSGCVAENMNLILTATTEKIPDVGLAAGCYSYNASNSITITDNTFRNITLSAVAPVTGTVDILYGCEYDYGKDNNFDLNTNFILDNNIQENITNTLIYK